jgi:hypothetical protein
MRVLDLFAGLGGWGSAFLERGHEVVSVDFNPAFGTTIVADVFDLKAKELGHFDAVLASPPCEKFSVLTIGRNWHTDGRPKTAGAAKAEALVWATRILIEDLDPAFFVIENPCGKLRVLRPLADMEMRTVTYCTYGAPWQKRTDLWGGFPPSLVLRPSCTNDNPCSDETRKAKPSGPRRDKDKRYGAYPARHGEISDNGGKGHVPAPRGSRTAIQSDTDNKDPRVLKWEEEMARIVASAGNTERARSRMTRGHVSDADVAGGPTKRHMGSAQNGEHPTRGNDIQRSAIRAMIPPELSAEVCAAVERDHAEGLTWRSGQRIIEAHAEGLFA